MKPNRRWIAILAAALLLVTMAFSVAACGDDDSASDSPNEDNATAPIDADDDDADDHDADDQDADADLQAFEYLEAAPKDALYLVEMTSFAFTPAVLEVKSGEVLEIAVQNVEPVLHDFTIDEIDADVHISYLGGTGQHAHAEAELEADLHFALTEPGTGVVHVKIHEPGEYVIYCSVPGHREAGMEGILIVE